MASAPLTVHLMPDDFRRWPMTDLHPASTTPELTNRLIAASVVLHPSTGRQPTGVASSSGSVARRSASRTCIGAWTPAAQNPNPGSTFPGSLMPWPCSARPTGWVKTAVELIVTGPVVGLVTGW